MPDQTADTARSDQARPPDHRAAVFAAQRWVAVLIDGLTRDQFGLPTPCPEFDVEALLKHLYGVADRVIAMGGGRDAMSVPASTADLPDDVAGGYRRRIAQGMEAWAEDEALGRMIGVPWGRAPGAIALSVYVAENLTHGWDLAVASGQDAEADPALAEIGLQIMSRVLPADGRNDFPFDNPVQPSAGAGPTERLANWTGRVRRSEIIPS